MTTPRRPAQYDLPNNARRSCRVTYPRLLRRASGVPFSTQRVMRVTRRVRTV